MVAFFASCGLVKGEDLDSKVVDHLQAISFTVDVGNGSGSGVVKNRNRDKDVYSFVWTAAHVVDGLKRQKTVIDPKTGSPKVIVFFEDAKVNKTLVENGRTVGKLEFLAKVVRFSSDEDLALLQVRKKNVAVEGVKFYLEEKPLHIGKAVFHVGSLLGEGGSQSMTTGIVSQVGRLIDDKVFDQITATSFPGSSGGGVFLNDGRLVGQVLRGAGEGFVLMAPSRRIVKWAREANIGWAVDDTVPFPSDKELDKIPVEDIGAIFSPSSTKPVDPSSPKKLFKVYN